MPHLRSQPFFFFTANQTKKTISLKKESSSTHKQITCSPPELIHTLSGASLLEQTDSTSPGPPENQNKTRDFSEHQRLPACSRRPMIFHQTRHSHAYTHPSFADRFFWRPPASIAHPANGVSRKRCFLRSQKGSNSRKRGAFCAPKHKRTSTPLRKAQGQLCPNKRTLPPDKTTRAKKNERPKLRKNRKKFANKRATLGHLWRQVRVAHRALAPPNKSTRLVTKNLYALLYPVLGRQRPAALSSAKLAFPSPRHTLLPKIAPISAEPITRRKV